jgi:DtxR family Mn-dependent transcriptional regulator
LGDIALKKTGLSESLEDYLEIILALEKTNKVARVKDIAEEMGVLRGTVTVALKTLGEKGLIHYKPYSFITLTRKGATVAKKITRRHSIIKDFLVNVLQIDDETAEANACRMEHAMDQAAVERLVRFIEHLRFCPRTDNDWNQSLVKYFAHAQHDRQKCNKCLDKLTNWALNAREPLE